MSIPARTAAALVATSLATAALPIIIGAAAAAAPTAAPAAAGSLHRANVYSASLSASRRTATFTHSVLPGRVTATARYARSCAPVTLTLVQGSRVVASGTGPATEERPANNWHGQLAELLENERLKLEISPIRDTIAAGALRLVELGARIQEPGRFTASLPALIDVAERQGIGHELDRRLLDAGASTIRLAQAAGQPLICLLPVTESALLGPEFVTQLGALSEQHPGLLAGLCILIPEGLVTRHLTRVFEFAGHLSRLGAHLALDDFGGGLLPFGNLSTLRPRYVKLSRSLTRQISRQPSSTALLRAIQEISSDLGIETIAEGIDDSQHISLLASLGIHRIAGSAAGPTEPLDVWTEGSLLRQRPVR